VRNCWAPQFLTLVFATSGCGSSKLPNHPDGSDAVDAVDARDTELDARDTSGPPDVGGEARDVADALDAAEASDARDTSADAISLEGGIACKSTTCVSGEICVRRVGGVDGDAGDFRCEPVPEGCQMAPTTDCLSEFIFHSFQCHAVTPRQYSCGEGGYGGTPDDFAVRARTPRPRALLPDDGRQRSTLSPKDVGPRTGG